MEQLDGLQAAFVAAEQELRAARGELAEAENSAFVSLDGPMDRVAAALEAYTQAKRRLSERVGDSSGDRK